MTIINADILRFLRQEMSKMKVASLRDKVYKDECVYSFDSPYSETGLYVNTKTFSGVGEDYLSIDSSRSNCSVYLHEKWEQVPISPSKSESKDPSLLGIGVQGGFLNSSKFEVIKHHSLVLLMGSTRTAIPLPNDEIPEFIKNVIQSIIEHEGMKLQLSSCTWQDDNVKINSKYVDNLEQINPEGKKISQDSKSWKDEASDATENLWLNLSTGYIGGGRKNWDGSGGSGSALQHYIDTGKKYPLVVKLGTITPHGADVWSYADDENCLVIDPFLADHLSFWGIDIMKLEKTEKSVSEMEVALNASYDWCKIMEGQEKLELISGPGLIGLRNIGSSCYLNSAMQCLLSIPEFQQRYYQHREQILATSDCNPVDDIIVQVSKLAHGILSDRYVPPRNDQTSIDNSLEETNSDSDIPERCVVAPRMFKHIVGYGHPDFSSGRQQDVSEYLVYFFEKLAKEEKNSIRRIVDEVPSPLTSALFEYHLEMKYKAIESNEVKFTPTGPQTLFNTLELSIPLDKAMVKIPTSEESPRPDSKRPRTEASSINNQEDLVVPFEACLEHYFEPEIVSLTHPVTQERDVPFSKVLRFKTFPRYLIIKLARYYIGDNWVQKKISAEVLIPEDLDLTSFTAQGKSSGEIEIKEEEKSSSDSEETFQFDEGLVVELISMGFSENGCRRAAFATKNANTEAALNWILEHMEDPDFNEPFDPTANSKKASKSTTNSIDEEFVTLMSNMGFSYDQCKAALLASNQNTERY